ncbi:MAG: hypothetical protein H6765_07275 [Candidatus Peribacteria bacterium]|nr:MAG: hypothetical protein H6765_07275 [Candidatus Peribacteria bacterium]
MKKYDYDLEHLTLLDSGSGSFDERDWNFVFKHLMKDGTPDLLYDRHGDVELVLKL